MDSKTQRDQIIIPRKEQLTAVWLSVPLITIYYLIPVCQSSFQWPMLSSHLRVYTVPFLMLSASCRPLSILFQLFPSTRSSVFVFLFQDFSRCSPSCLWISLLRSLLLTLMPCIWSGPFPYYSVGRKCLFLTSSYSSRIYLLDVQNSLWNTELCIPQLTLDNYNNFFSYQGILGHFY